MVPSGDVVDKVEKERRLKPSDMKPVNGAFGLSWNTIERMQGGKLKRP